MDHTDDGSARPGDLADEQLLLAVGRGHAGAFASLFERFSRVVHRVAGELVGDRSLADEIVQEVMLDVWRRADRFDPTRGSALAWLLTITRRRAIDRLRSDSAREDRQRRVGRQRETTAGVDDAVIEADERRELWFALNQLTALQREAIELAFWGEMTYRQVAGVLGIPTGTAKTRLRDGVVRLRGVMAMRPTDGAGATA